jgi:hypothetical protein
MITLGTIRLRHQSSIFDARHKIRGLAEALGYDSITCTRLATAVSEATRALLVGERDSSISVALDLASSPSRLVLDFESSGAIPHLAGISGFFDDFSTRAPRDGLSVLRAAVRLPSPAF